jgi:hypothetical protein
MGQSYLLVALATGLVVAIALGGRPRFLAEKSFRWWLLLPLGVVLQQVVEAEGVPWPFTLLVISYAYLLVFALANLRHPGMGIVFIGIALNALVIFANHGMPVREGAIRSAHHVASDSEIRIDEVKHHLEDGDDRFMALADIIPVPQLSQVVSFGDLILAVGVADLLVHLLRPTHAARARRRETEDTVAGDASVVDLTRVERDAVVSSS